MDPTTMEKLTSIVEVDEVKPPVDDESAEAEESTNGSEGAGEGEGGGEAESEDADEFDIPEVGKVKASDVRAAMLAQERLSKLEADGLSFEDRMAQLAEREEKLKDARTISDLLEIPELRERVLGIVEEMVSEPDKLSKKDGKRPDLSKFRDSRLDEVMGDIKAVRELIAKQENAAVMAEIDKMKSRFVEMFPDDVTDAAWDAILQDAAKAKGKALDFSDIENLAYRQAFEKGWTRKGAEDAARKAIRDMAGKKLENGAVVVIQKKGEAPKAKEKPPAPKNLSELTAALTKVVYG